MSMDFNFLMNDIATQARQELIDGGYTQLETAEAVNEAFSQKGTSLVMVNSVCGCAGGIARPAALHSIHYDKRPDNLFTVFAGQDKEATAQARAIFGDDHLPSSPSFVFLKDGKMVDEIGRHEIEGHDPMSVITHIQAIFEQHCDEV
ncbi:MULTISPECIES: BrxA/BrxB family bacilliredoxin [Planococcus]|jgi:putative YphP/YqiW family bacilliredoxin|uniref:BrxA/BrxB family bacilliredoxin n=1 Tax=Planococcus TaxID=1372 RepID=UPI00115E51BE|nr:MULTISPECIES: BrxA/BrxB family bacilliredoxin [Planococcus]MBT2571665.1 BrxA/BrxB family bacilliredoxin [Planococcus sp. ISL-110]